MRLYFLLNAEDNYGMTPLHHALIRGREALSGAPVEATDIRAGAGLVLAGLVAQGSTMVYGVSHIDRGYAGFVETLQGLGAKIERVED